MQEIQRVGAIIDKVDSGATRNHSQPKQTSCSRWSSDVIQQLLVDLGTARRRFDEEAVVAVGRQDMAVGGIASPSGSLIVPFEVTSLSAKAVEWRASASGMAAMRLFRLSAT